MSNVPIQPTLARHRVSSISLVRTIPIAFAVRGAGRGAGRGGGEEVEKAVRERYGLERGIAQQEQECDVVDDLHGRQL